MSTKIEWTDETWNIVTGCTRVSPGCEHCYIERTPPFRATGRRFSGPQIGATTGLRFHADRLERPLRWTKPRRVFVCSLADLFHHQVPDTYLAMVWATMWLARQHTFQVLTKRPRRMRSLLSSEDWWELVTAAAEQLIDQHPRAARGILPAGPNHPLANAWLLTSVEDQLRADQRIPLLLDTPAAVRGISAEPLLGPVDLSAVTHREGDAEWRTNPLTREAWCVNSDSASGYVNATDGVPGLDWVIVGGESGPGARSMNLAWARSLVEQCRAAAVPAFVKQLGARPIEDVEGERELLPTRVDLRDTKGGDWSEWPEDLRVREYPEAVATS